MNKTSLQRLKWIHRSLTQMLFPFIARDYARFSSLLHRSSNRRFKLALRNIFPFVFDKTSATPFDRHYIYHTAWAARVVRQIAPQYHVDISSTLYFSSIVSAFIPVRFYDYRPPALVLSNHSSAHADLLDLPFPDESVSSLSCMHSLEHVGLGRYGDELDPDGDLKAADELQRVVTRGGHLLVVVPIGKPVLRFNAMRVYSYDQVLRMFPRLSLREFSLIHEYEEDGGITANATQAMTDKEEYGCGCFWFVKEALETSRPPDSQ